MCIFLKKKGFEMRKLRFLFLLICSSCLFNGCVTSALWSFTDERPEAFIEYTDAWVGSNELIIAYDTERGERWNAISLEDGKQSIFTGRPSFEEQQAKRPIPIIVEKRTSDFHYYKSRFRRDSNQVDQLGNIVLVGNPQRYRDPTATLELIVEPIGNAPKQYGKSISPPKMPRYTPWWAYPTRIVGAPIALCLDVAVIPLFFVSRVAIKVRL